MEFGRFSFAHSCSVLTFSLVLLCSVDLMGWAQEAPAPSPAGNTVPALPPVEPIAQAAAGSANKSESVKAAPDGAPSSPVAVSNEDLSLLRLGAGDLIEVSVYNVPELTTKARVGTSGEVYLPLIDYVHVADLTVEEAQRMIQKRARHDLSRRSTFAGSDDTGRCNEARYLSSLGEPQAVRFNFGGGGIRADGGTEGEHHPAAQSGSANHGEPAPEPG